MSMQELNVTNSNIFEGCGMVEVSLDFGVRVSGNANAILLLVEGVLN